MRSAVAGHRQRARDRVGEPGPDSLSAARRRAFRPPAARISGAGGGGREPAARPRRRAARPPRRAMADIAGAARDGGAAADGRCTRGSARAGSGCGPWRAVDSTSADLGPVLAGLLGDLGQVGDVEPLAVEHQVVERPPGRARHVVGERRPRRRWRPGPRRSTATSTNATCLACRPARRRPGAPSAAASSRWAARLRAAISRRFAERARGGRGQVAGHAATARRSPARPRADRPGERRWRRPQTGARGSRARPARRRPRRRARCTASRQRLDLGRQPAACSRSGSVPTRRRTSTLSRARSRPRAATRTLAVSTRRRQVRRSTTVRPARPPARSRRCAVPARRR